MTRNFQRIEFERAGFPKDATIKEEFMLSLLVRSLQVIRDEIGVPITITNCYRTEENHRDLLNRGYYPSETSDHFFGQRLPVHRPDKIKKYGKYFDLSVGATDFVCANITYNFSKIVHLAVSGQIRVGQLILETGNGKTWIHISNDPELVYGQALSRRIPSREKFLYSLDGGASYIPYQVKG